MLGSQQVQKKEYVHVVRLDVDEAFHQAMLDSYGNKDFVLFSATRNGSVGFEKTKQKGGRGERTTLTFSFWT